MEKNESASSSPRKLMGWALGRVAGVTRGKLVFFDPTLVFRQLASMLRSGVGLPQALGYLAEEFDGRVNARLLAVRDRVEGGEPLSAALAQLPTRWLPIETLAAIAAGERTGRLPEVLDGLARERELALSFTARMRGVVVYPLLLLLLASGVLGLVLGRVIPTFAALYAALGSTLPWGTRVVIAAWGPVVMPLVLVSAWLLARAARAWFDPALPILPFGLGSTLGRRLPFFRGIHLSLLEMRFARTLALLLEAGVPMPDAIDLTAAVIGRSDDATALADAARRVRDGVRPSEALAGLPFLSPSFLFFLGDSEKRGDFVEVARAMAVAAEERFESRVDVATRVLEPAAIVAVGALIGFVVVHLYAPLFGLYGKVG